MIDLIRVKAARICGLAQTVVVLAGCAAAAAQPAVFPKPREIELRTSSLSLAGGISVVVPRQASAEDLDLARFLIAELGERHGVAAHLERAGALPEKRPFILMGSARSPLVAEAIRGKALAVPEAAEGYALDSGPDGVVVAGADDAGAFYAVQTLRQLIRGSGTAASIGGARVRDWPLKPFRGVKLYLPGRENIGYFKRFVRDFLALYKYNTLIVEMNAAMRFDRHPELNAGWIEFGKNLNYTRRERSPGPGRQFQDSANADTADFGVLEKEEVAELVAYARRHHVEVIPEVPSLTHSYYLLTRHRELAEVPDAEWPDTYCPSEPRVYPLLFDVLDEFIEVMRPKTIHVGHDEWRMPLGVCRRCAGKDPTELFAADLRKIYDHLRAKGVGTAIWADHLVESVRGEKVKAVANPKGQPYVMPGALTPEQVSRLVPKDILLFNWFWDTRNRGLGEPNEQFLQGLGFRQVYGNFRPDIENFDRRAAGPGMMGGAPSSWAATNELNFGKDLMWEFLGCANLLWSTDRPDARKLAETVQALLPGIRRNLSAVPYPSADLAPEPFPVSPGWNPGPAVVGADLSSLIFLHACKRPARNAPAYTATWNFADTAELVGWYEVVYEDGLRVSVPLRYGVHILETGWGKAPKPGKAVAYYAEAGERDGMSLFAYEWINPRFGKPIREVLTHAIQADNGIYLAGISGVPKRKAPDPKPLRLVSEPFHP